MNIATWLCTAERSFYRTHAGGSTAPDGLHPVGSFGCSRSGLPLVVGSVGLNRWLFLDPHIQRGTGIVEFARVLRVGKLEHHLGVCVLAELWLHLPPPHGEGARRRIWLARDVKIDNGGARLFVERCEHSPLFVILVRLDQNRLPDDSEHLLTTVVNVVDNELAARYCRCAVRWAAPHRGSVLWCLRWVHHPLIQRGSRCSSRRIRELPDNFRHAAVVTPRCVLCSEQRERRRVRFSRDVKVDDGCATIRLVERCFYLPLLVVVVGSDDEDIVLCHSDELDIAVAHVQKDLCITEAAIGSP
eukprot:m.316317 g.316317  ORF g.316317 m.316317 type:complete len:301 (+) comp27543_c0_seq1:3558-4460(+)